MDYIIVSTRSNGYTPEQCGKTLTVGDLIKILREHDKNAPVYLSYDDGYTFGSLRASDFGADEE